MEPLPREFYCRATLDVARELLGKTLIHRMPDGVIHVRIVDVEAYIGSEDRACHASRGRTRRTEVMFGPPGHTYVYLIYGMYHCLNLVTEPEGFPAAVLIRGIECTGSDVDENRGTSNRIDGPGRVCRHMEIDRSLNGIDVTVAQRLWVVDHGLMIDPQRIEALPRVGVDYAGEWAKKLWRFRIPPATIERPARKVVPSR
ncbi:MAG: DNA-3-methyladenine glycosylase [Nitrospirae bacterium]|nr:MAG: DNA-3-methyladenine glycosylase [Nitrospirota bacterium]